MTVKEFVQSELTKYAAEQNLTIQDAIDKLLKFAPTITDGKSSAILAWEVLQILNASTLHYHKFSECDCIYDSELFKVKTFNGKDVLLRANNDVKLMQLPIGFIANSNNVSPTVIHDIVINHGALTVYHGTTNPNFKPDPNYENEETDYGSGLYLTPYLDLAKEWSKINAILPGYVYEFSLDFSNLDVFDIDKPILNFLIVFHIEKLKLYD